MSLQLSVDQAVEALLRQPQAYVDRAESRTEREALLRPVASIMVRVATTREDFAMLAELGYRETRWARAVIEGHCDRMPRGQRCDHGRARGPWQVHSWCARGWAAPDGSLEALEAQAVCAVGHWHYALNHCRGRAASLWAGAFSGYAGGSCTWPPAATRAAEMRVVLALLPYSAVEAG